MEIFLSVNFISSSFPHLWFESLIIYWKKALAMAPKPNSIIFISNQTREHTIITILSPQIRRKWRQEEKLLYSKEIEKYILVWVWKGLMILSKLLRISEDKCIFIIIIAREGIFILIYHTINIPKYTQNLNDNRRWFSVKWKINVG